MFARKSFYIAIKGRPHRKRYFPPPPKKNLTFFTVTKNLNILPPFPSLFKYLYEN